MTFKNNFYTFRRSSTDVQHPSYRKQPTRTYYQYNIGTFYTETVTVTMSFCGYTYDRTAFEFRSSFPNIVYIFVESLYREFYLNWSFLLNSTAHTQRPCAAHRVKDDETCSFLQPSGVVLYYYTYVATHRYP